MPCEAGTALLSKLKLNSGMNDKSDALKLLLKRFLISLPLLVISTVMFMRGKPLSLIAVFPLVPVAYLLGPPLTALVVDPAGSIFFPESGTREINLMFSMPEARIMEGKYEEALELLKEMIPRDPQRLEIYMRIMGLAVNRMKQPDVARETFHAGVKNLNDLRKRRVLAREYRRLMVLFREETERN